MGWWLCVTVQTLLLPCLLANMLLDYGSLEPNIFSWGDDTPVARVDPREASALLARLVRRTVAHLRHTGLRQRELTHRSVPDLEEALNNNHTKIPAEGWKNDVQGWKTSFVERRPDNESNMVGWNHPVQMNHTGIQADDTNDPVSWNHTGQPWTKEDLLRKTKKEVYRKLLLRALRYHRQAQQHLLHTLRTKGLQESILKQWLIFITGPDALHRILKEAETSHHPSDAPEGKYTSRSDVQSYHNPKPDMENPMRPGKYTQTVRKLQATRPTLREQDGTQAASLRPMERTEESSGNNNLINFLITIVKNAQNYNYSSHTKRHRRSQAGMMYLPVGGTKKAQCPTAADAAGVSITQMAFLSICLTVFNIVVNVNNNINNNNNNNNINTDNNLNNNNAQLSLNVNNAAQVNVMLPPPIPGRRRRSSLRATWRQVHHNATAQTLHLLQQLLQEQEKGEFNQEVSETGSGNLTSVMITRFTEPDVWSILDDLSLPALLPVSDALSSRQDLQDITTPAPVTHRRRSRAPSDDTKRSEEHPSPTPAPPTVLYPGWEDRRVTAEGMGEVRGSCKGVAVTQNLQQDMNMSEDLRRGVEVKTELQKGAGVAAGLQEGADVAAGRQEGTGVAAGHQEGAGVAAGLLRVMDRWMKDSPLASPACLGLQLCGSLDQHRPHHNVWLTVLASFAAYQRVTGGALSLHQFVRSAVRGRGCRLLFPTCQQSLTN